MRLLITRLCLWSTGLFCTVQSVHAQLSDADYKKNSAEARAEIWAWNKPAFNNRTVPDEFANASSVVLAHDNEIIATSKKKLRFYGGFALSKSIYYSNTVRELVKINDKAALEDYSSVSFQRLSKGYGFYRKSIIVTVGVRIIKPDGTMKEVNTDEAVSLQNEKNSKKSKLAISGLQVGDIVDYFIRTEELIENQSIDPLRFVLGDNNPILDYRVHCEIGKGLAVEYRIMNGAPDFKVSRGTDDENIMDIEKKNIPSLPTDLWMSGMRQIPLIRMNLVTAYPRGRQERKLGETYKNIPLEDVLGEVKQELEGYNYQLLAAGSKVPFYPEVNELVKEYKKSHKGHIIKDSLATFIYYAARHYALNNWDKAEVAVGRDRNFQQVSNKKFMFVLEKLLKKFDIECDYIFVASRYGPDLKQVMYTDDIDYMLRTRTENPFYLCVEGVFTQAGYILPDYEGQSSPTAFVKKIGAHKEDDGTAKVPGTTAFQNEHAETVQIQFSDGNPLQLTIDRTVDLKGHMRSDDQKRLLLFEQYEAEERMALGIKETLLEDLADSRKTKNLTAEYEAAFAKARKEQPGFFKEEIKEQYDADPKELLEYKILNSGIFHQQPDLVYRSKFLMDGWVKKAGNNYIVDAGKFIGSQLQIKPAQRNRTVDVYMPYARSFEYNVEMPVPAGYKVEGIENLNREVKNDCGSFVAVAKLDAGKIILHIRKEYKNAFEPVSQWPKLLAIIDLANEWGNQKMMLRKL